MTIVTYSPGFTSPSRGTSAPSLAEAQLLIVCGYIEFSATRTTPTTAPLSSAGTIFHSDWALSNVLACMPWMATISPGWMERYWR